MFEGYTHEVHCVAVGPDESWAISGGYDGVIRVWELATGRCLRSADAKSDVKSLAMDPKGRWVLSGTFGSFLDRRGQTLRLWDPGSCRCIRTYDVQNSVPSVAATPDGRFVVAAVDTGSAIPIPTVTRLRLLEVATGQCLQTFVGHELDVSSVAVAPDGRWALSGSGDNTVRLWELATGRCLRCWEAGAIGIAAILLLTISPFVIERLEAGRNRKKGG